VYISGHALVILGGPQTLLQTIYVDETKTLEAVTIDEASGKIAVCGGPDVFIYQPYGIQHETLKVRVYCPMDGGGRMVLTLLVILECSGPFYIPFAAKMMARQSEPCPGAPPTSYSWAIRTLHCGS